MQRFLIKQMMKERADMKNKASEERHQPEISNEQSAEEKQPYSLRENRSRDLNQNSSIYVGEKPR